MKKIVITKPGTINDETKHQLFVNGYFVIETEDPKSIRVLSSEPNDVDANDLTMAALYAIKIYGGADHFVKDLHKRLVEKESKPVQPCAPQS